MALPGKHAVDDGRYVLLYGPCRKSLTEVRLNGRSLSHHETPTSCKDFPGTESSSLGAVS